MAVSGELWRRTRTHEVPEQVFLFRPSTRTLLLPHVSARYTQLVCVTHPPRCLGDKYSVISDLCAQGLTRSPEGPERSGDQHLRTGEV